MIWSTTIGRVIRFTSIREFTWGPSSRLAATVCWKLNKIVNAIYDLVKSSAILFTCFSLLRVKIDSPHVKQILLVYNHKSTITMKRYAYIIGVIHSVVTLTWPGYLHSLIWNLNAILLIQIFWNGDDRIRTPAWKRMNSKALKNENLSISDCMNGPANNIISDLYRIRSHGNHLKLYLSWPLVCARDDNMVLSSPQTIAYCTIAICSGKFELWYRMHGIEICW